MANALGAGLSIPGTDTGIRDLVTQLGTYRQKSEATAEQAKTDLAGIGREQEAEIGRASEGMAPAQKRVTDMSRQFPEPKARTPMPETPKAPSFDPKEMQDTMGILVAFAALGGALTRQPMTAALNNFSAGVHGLVQGKQQVYDNSLKEFKTNFDTAKAKNDEIWHEWKAAIDKHGADIQGAKDELSMIAAKHQLSMQSFLLRSGRIVEATKLTQHAQDVGIQAAEKVTGLMIQDERFRQQGLDRQEARADRAAMRAAVAERGDRRQDYREDKDTDGRAAKLRAAYDRQAKEPNDWKRTIDAVRTSVISNQPLGDIEARQFLTSLSKGARSTNMQLKATQNFGDLGTRVAGSLTNFFNGRATDEQRRLMLGYLDSLETGVVKPELEALRDRYTFLANEERVRPSRVFGYDVGGGSAAAPAGAFDPNAFLDQFAKPGG